MKRHGGKLRAHGTVKGYKPSNSNSRLFWKRQNAWRQRTDERYQGLVGKGYKEAEHRGFLGQKNTL